jgi:hypothetical protein
MKKFIDAFSWLRGAGIELKPSYAGVINRCVVNLLGNKTSAKPVFIRESAISFTIRITADL